MPNCADAICACGPRRCNCRSRAEQAAGSARHEGHLRRTWANLALRIKAKPKEGNGFRGINMKGMIVYDSLGRVIRKSESAGVREFVAAGISAGIQAAFDRCEVVGRKDLSKARG
ncbi:hypothetical protein SBA1_640007 [Candidatus Sulfotelmatobacter kueseliae]|uniref:Uncharacterized protein n=1 Tax=Candidatus Sulfotelmatobacter kueseliae TaxID=2042962 RepID=A0A2U3L339_9BACT|nr:hypothetical protein SBA1_640007 [Candidatus Sulfotelmatobacter kueseliae]